MLKTIAFLTILLVIAGCDRHQESLQGENFLSNVNQVSPGVVDDRAMLTFFDNPRNPIDHAMEMLPAGDNRPDGWIEEMMVNDLKKGMVGALDDLFPAFGKDDIFNKDRRGGLDDVPEMGNIVLTGAEWEQSIMWWNSETMGNWFDGFVRHAFLIRDEEAMAKAKTIVDNLVASQDEDGYIGIYKTNLRYQHEGSNGELWAKTTAFRTMLGYYELTKDERVLAAVEKGMEETMRGYNMDARHPFNLKNAFGGVTHGLMITDALETLHRITGKQVYQDYAVYLYRAFSDFSINRAFNDLRYPYLIKKDSLFTGHGVHTYEHFRTLVNAYYATGYPELKEAYENSLYKLDQTLLPSGAGHAMEWIAGQKADPDHTATEFCSMLELRNSLGAMLQKSGDLSFADKAEKLTFNGMMGFRNLEGTAITYGKHDNEYILDGHVHHGEEPEPEVRYKYSPMHDDPAVCCAPNYARNYAYYVDMMWMKKGEGLASVLYGPSQLNTTIAGSEIAIEQTTNYPFSDAITFTVKNAGGQSIPLYFRKPGWVSSMEVKVQGAEVVEEDGFYKVTKPWIKGDIISIAFHHELKLKEAGQDHHFLQRGPLVFAYEIPSEKEVFRVYDLENFSDYYVLPTNQDHKHWDLVNVGHTVDQKQTSARNPWIDPDVKILAKVVDRSNGEQQQIQFRPMGGTALRKVTFRIANE